METVFRSAHLPFSVKFDQTVQLCRILRDGVLRIVVYRAVGGLRQEKSTHFETSSSTQESNLLGLSTRPGTVSFRRVFSSLLCDRCRSVRRPTLPLSEFPARKIDLLLLRRPNRGVRIWPVSSADGSQFRKSPGTTDRYILFETTSVSADRDEPERRLRCLRSLPTTPFRSIDGTCYCMNATYRPTRPRRRRVFWCVK